MGAEDVDASACEMDVGNMEQEIVPLENAGENVGDGSDPQLESVQSVKDNIVEVQGDGPSEDLRKDDVVETDGLLIVGDETLERNEESVANDMMAGLSLDEAENAFRVKEKLDSISIIQELRFKPVDSSRLKIPLCRMIPLPLVRPLLHSDVRRLEAEFVHGYREGDRVFYVSISDDAGKSKLVTEEIMGSWDRHWLHENEAFERQLSQNIHLSSLSGHMFFIWDGNHRFQAWKSYISRLHLDEAEWHFSVDSILLTSKGSTGILLNAMNDVNRSTENAHVKTNLVHKLHRISSYGVLKLPDFKELLTTDEYKACETRPKPYPWYPVTSEVFIKFLNRQDVSGAADEAARLYMEKTAKADRTARGIHDAMESASQARVKSYRTEFDKMISVANPKHGPKFLEAIYYHWSQFEKPEMSLEKLQKIASTIVEPEFKVKWLNWWNSGDMNRVGLRFPAVGVTDDKLEAWLTKATFWAQLEFATVQAVNETMKSEEITVDWKANDDVDEIEEYIEKYRIILWDQAFFSFFRKSGDYSRFKPFLSQDGAKRAMQRLQYRYFKRELLGKKAIDKKSFPKLFGGWLERSLKDSYMFTPGQVRSFNSIEHTACPWYLECPKKFVPSEEEAEKALNASPTKPAEDSDADMSEDAPSEIEVKKTTKKGKETKGIKAPKKTMETVKSIETKESLRSSKGKGKAEAVVVVTASETVSVAPINPGTLSNPTHCPTELLSMSTEIFAPSQLYEKTAKRSDTHGVDAKVLLLKTSVHSIMQFMVLNQQPSPEFSQLLSFAQKVEHGHEQLLGGVPKREACLDLIVADVPDGLPIPNMEASVPTWNALAEDWPESIFEVARDTLQDDGAVMLFHPDIPDVRQATDALAEAYGFTTLYDWWGVNDMLLTSYKNHTRTTKRFWIILYVKESYFDNPILSKFSIEVNRDLSNLGTDIVGQGALYNYTTSITALKNGDKMWRGAREKDPVLVQLLIESFSKPGDVVLDCNASTGSSIHACRRSGRHLIALECDDEIFEAVLVPLSSVISTKGSIGEKRKEPPAPEGTAKERPTKRIAKNRMCTLVDLFSSPPSPLSLPCYIEAMAIDLAKEDSPTEVPSLARYDPNVRTYIDYEAKEVIVVTSSGSTESGFSATLSDSSSMCVSSSICVSKS